MTTAVNPIVEAAYYYASLGFPVFPLKPKGKTPLTTHGLKDASTDPGVIQKWWSKYPTANVGIVTGPESGLAVLDIDAKTGGPANLDFLEKCVRLQSL